MTTEIEKKFLDEFKIDPSACGKYTGLEECCHTSFCYDGSCPYGIGGRKYPQITDSVLLKLICIITENCYSLEVYNTLTSQGTNEFMVTLIREPDRYFSHSEDLKVALLNAIKLIKDDEDIQVEVQSLFKSKFQ